MVGFCSDLTLQKIKAYLDAKNDGISANFDSKMIKYEY